MILEHDAVALIRDVPSATLRRGDVGAVVHVYPDRQNFEVEFFDKRGKTNVVATVPAGHLMRLNVLPLPA